MDGKAQKALEVIDKQLNDLTDIYSSTIKDRTFPLGFEKLTRWRIRTIRLLTQYVHPDEGKKLERKAPQGIPTGTPQSRYLAETQGYLSFLMTLQEELQKYPEDILSGTAPESSPSLIVTTKEPTASRSVFIVHGHDEATKESVARFLEKLDLKPVILHEQPDRGRTIIEKLEANASDVDIAYAVVLLTPDDLGSTVADRANPKPRARQNVVFELGYFIAKIGRERVRALYSEGVESPSDYKGVLYTKLDPAGGWQLELAKEIKAAGIEIDLNKLTQQ